LQLQRRKFGNFADFFLFSFFFFFFFPFSLFLLMRSMSSSLLICLINHKQLLIFVRIIIYGIPRLLHFMPLFTTIYKNIFIKFMLYVWYLDAKFLPWSIARVARKCDCRIKKERKKKEKKRKEERNDSALYKVNKDNKDLFFSFSLLDKTRCVYR